MILQTTTRKGNCEVCEVEATLYCGKGNIWMCAKHKAEDDALTTQNAKNVIEYSRKIDSIVELKADVFVSEATSFVALQAAILQNDEIPVDQKNSALLAEMDVRIKALTAAILTQKKELAARENARIAMLHNAQEVAARLKESEKAKWKQYDINYPVTPVKKPAAKAGKSNSTFNKSALYAACKKYGDLPAAQVQGIMVSQNLDAEGAALFLFKLLRPTAPLPK
jgi:hypothetical protein